MPYHAMPCHAVPCNVIDKIIALKVGARYIYIYTAVSQSSATESEESEVSNIMIKVGFVGIRDGGSVGEGQIITVGETEDLKKSKKATGAGVSG